MRKNCVLSIFFGAGVALCLALLLVLGLAALIWWGTLPTSAPSIILSICMGVCAFVGGRFAIGRGSEPMLTGIAAGGLLAGLMMGSCLVTSARIPLHGGFLATILLTLAGGGFAGLLGGKKKRKKKKKK